MSQENTQILPQAPAVGVQRPCSAISVKLHELQLLLGKIIDTPSDWDWDWRTDARELYEELEELLKRKPERHDATQAFVDWCPDKSAGIRQAYYHGYMDGSASWPNNKGELPLFDAAKVPVTDGGEKP